MLLATGCCNCPRTARPKLYTGPTLPIEAVVEKINANNQKIPTLWASLNYSATIHDNGQTHTVSGGDGFLLYRRPDDFRLVAKKEFAGTVFDLGTNGKEYWLLVLPGTNRMWWGRYADLVHTPPGQLPIPIRPDLVLSVLGVSLIDTDFNQQPAPVMRFNNEQDAYVFLFNAHLPDRWVAVREVWYDRQTLLPRRVILYDTSGRAVLRAELSMYRKVQAPGAQQADWPVVAGDYKLLFPDSGSRMEFTLTDARLYKQNLGSRLKAPNPASFQMPEAGADVRTIQIGGGGGQ